MEQIDELRQLLPKYKLLFSTAIVCIRYPKYDFICTCLFTKFSTSTELVKFIHDNFDYFIEMIILNGFVRYGDHIKCYFRRDYIFIILYADGIIVKYVIEENWNDAVCHVLADPKIMFDELRKIIDVDISYKPIRSTFAHSAK